MNDLSYDIKNLSKKEISTLLECLLFSSSVDVCASWYQDNIQTMLNLTKKIRVKMPEILTENIYLLPLDENGYESKHSNEILKIFPELEKQNI
jgi:hypothetical protein